VASYVEEVLADAPYRYWRMSDASSPLAEESGSTGITLTGATPGVAGATTQLGNAVSFDGVDDRGRVATGVDLSDTNVITVEFWMLWDAHGTNDDLATEFGDTNAAGGYVVNPNTSGGATQFSAFMANGAGGFENHYITPRPSAAAWHHYAFVFNRAAAVGSKITFYVDGAAVTEIQNSTITTAGNFGNLPLNIMSRAGTSLFGAGDMQHYAIYKTALSAGRIAAHYAARANDPSGGTDVSLTPGAVTALGATRAPTVTTGSNVNLNPSAAVAVGATRAPTPLIRVFPSAATATAGMPALITVATFTADAANATAGTNAPAVSTGASVNVTPSAALALGATRTPTVTASLTRTPSAAAAAAGTLAPVVQASGNVTLSPAAQAATAGTSAPTVSLGFGITLPAVTASSGTFAPAVGTAGNVTVNALAAAALAGSTTPALSISSVFALAAATAAAGTRVPATYGPAITYIGRAEPALVTAGRVD
jgi:hypothetical protein